MESAIKNALGVTTVIKEIECADRIVDETGIYEAVVVSARPSEFFSSIFWSGTIFLIDSEIAI